MYRMFGANLPAVLSVCPVAELKCDVLVQRGGGGVRAGPAEQPASITWITYGQIVRWLCSHCTTQGTDRCYVLLKCINLGSVAQFLSIIKPHSQSDSCDWQMWTHSAERECSARQMSRGSPSPSWRRRRCAWCQWQRHGFYIYTGQSCAHLHLALQ